MVKFIIFTFSLPLTLQEYGLLMISYGALITTLQVFHLNIHVALAFNLKVVFLLPFLYPEHGNTKILVRSH
jgi:hypothetical protein